MGSVYVASPERVPPSEGGHALEPEILDAAGQNRVGEQPPSLHVGLHAEHRAHEECHRPRGPRLRAARERVLYGAGPLVASIARKDLGEAVLEAPGGVEERRSYPVGLLPEAVAPEALHDERVVVRPD